MSKTRDDDPNLNTQQVDADERMSRELEIASRQSMRVDNEDMIAV
jgi:hypothetical protein